MEDDVMSKIAVVTGASSGLGREFVVQISEKYKTIDEIWVIARRAERLYALEREIEGKKIIVLPLDITKQEDLEAYKKMLAKEHPWVRVLVNAAGYGIMGHVEDVVCEELTGMIDVNCKALVAMTKITLPYMKNRAISLILHHRRHICHSHPLLYMQQQNPWLEAFQKH